MAELSFHLSDFEGPLDLLLHLISKHKLNIIDIEISELLRQYLLTIETSDDRDIEAHSEFLEMAARLVHIKTVMLLPKHEEEADELKTRLSEELMEYSLCRMAAAKLGELAEKHRVRVRVPMELEGDPTYTLTHPASMLYDALSSATGRVQRKLPPKREEFSPLVEKPVVSVGSRIVHLMRRMYQNGSMPFGDVFSDQRDRSSLVATFLALLELMKAGRITVDEDGTVNFHRTKRTKEESAT